LIEERSRALKPEVVDVPALGEQRTRLSRPVVVAMIDCFHHFLITDEIAKLRSLAYVKAMYVVFSFYPRYGPICA
jgi:hypothetical protein